MWKNIAIVSDFSKTLTSKTNPTTWSVFAKSGLLWEEYTKKRNDFYNKYYNFEENWNIEKTQEWFGEHLKLFIKYWLNNFLVKQITSNKKYFLERNWLIDFLNYINENDIKLFVISSWITNFIELFLKNLNIDIKNIQILSNNLIEDSNWNFISCINNDKITTPLNKNINNLDLTTFDKVILLWDDSSDLKMYNWNCFKIWFCDKNDADFYDIYLWKDWNLVDILKYL